MAPRGPPYSTSAYSAYRAAQRPYYSSAQQDYDSSARAQGYGSLGYSTSDEKYTPVAPRAYRQDYGDRHTRDEPPRGPRADRHVASNAPRFAQQYHQRDDPYAKPRPAPPLDSPSRKSSPTLAHDSRRRLETAHDPRRVERDRVLPSQVSKPVERRAQLPVRRSWNDKDPSIPLLYCCPSIGSDPSLLHQIKATTLHPHLDLRFLPSLGDLSRDLHEVSAITSSLSGVRRKCFVTPVARPETMVALARPDLLNEPVILRDALTISHLEDSLELEEAEMVNQATKKRAAPKLSPQDQEIARKDQLARTHRPQVALAPVAEKGEIQAIQRRETSAISPTVLALEAVAAGMELDTASAAADLEEGEIVESSTSAVRDEASSSPFSARKRQRTISAGSEDKVEAHRYRAALEDACKKPRKGCAQRAIDQGHRVTDEAIQADNEAVLGERVDGLWSIYKKELCDLSPQVQILMARALRDADKLDLLKLYDHPESTELLKKTVPWFVQLLEPIADRTQAFHNAAELQPQNAEVNSKSRAPAPTVYCHDDLFGVSQ